MYKRQASSSEAAKRKPAAEIKPTTKPARTSRRHSRRKQKSPWSNPILWGGIGAGLLGIIMVFDFLNNTTIESNGKDDRNKGDTTKEVTKTNPEAPIVPKDTDDETDNSENASTETVGSVLLIEDDGETLWASPTDGDPVDLAWTPPGAQLFVTINIADLLTCLLYTSPSPRDKRQSRMPSSA